MNEWKASRSGYIYAIIKKPQRVHDAGKNKLT